MRRLLILLGFAALLLLAGRLFHAAPTNPAGLLASKDPDRAEYERFIQRFPDRKYGGIVVSHGPSADVLGASSEISDFLSRWPAVGRIISPQNARYFLGSEYLHFAALFPKPDLTEDARDRLRAEVWRRLLSPDHPDEFLITFEYEPAATVEQEGELTRGLEKFLPELGRRFPGVNAYSQNFRLNQGFELLKFERFLRAEIPVLVSLLGLALALLFGSSQIVAWCLAVVLATLATTLIAMHLMSGGVGPLGVLTLAIVTTIAAGGTVFFFGIFEPAGGRLTQRISEAKARAERPALLYSLALAALFAGCGVSRLAPVRELGWACVLACLLQWVFTFRLLPLALPEVGIHAPPRRLPFKLGRKRVRVPRSAIVVALVVLFSISALASSQVRPSDNLLVKYIPMRKVDLLLKPKYWNAFDPDNQAELLAFEQRVATLPGVERVISLPVLSDSLVSILAMRKPGRGEKLRVELLTTLDELGALRDLISPGAKELRSVVMLKGGGDFKPVTEAIEALSRQVEGKFAVELAGAARLRKALATP